MQNKFPLVSVIIPTHNRPELLKRTLLSIVNQSYPSLEIIVISNGISIINRNVVEELQDSRVCYLEQNDSGGPSSPRNHGIQKAQGEYVAFCDDDDLWMPNKVEKQVEALVNNYEYGLCYSKMLRFNQEKEWSISHEEGPADLKSLLYINTVPISSVLMKKTLLIKYGGFSESKCIGSSEDYEFLLRYSVITKFYFIDEYLIKYWSGDDRITDNQMNIRRLYRYLIQIFCCYAFLFKTGKIKIYNLIFPVFYNIKLFAKSLCYQMLISMKNLIKA